MNTAIASLLLLSCLAGMAVSQIPYPYPDPIKQPLLTCLPVGSTCDSVYGTLNCCPGTYCSPTAGGMIKGPQFLSTCISGFYPPPPPILPYPYPAPLPLPFLNRDNAGN